MKRALFALCTLGLTATGCGVAQELYNARVDELNKTKADMDASAKKCAADKKERDDKIDALTKENGGLKDHLTALGQDVNKSQADLSAAKKTMEEMRKAQEAADARLKQFKDLMAKFKSMVDSGKLKVEIRNGLMLVKLADNILFDPGKTELKKDGQAAIKEVSAILAAIPGRKFQVAGHTDDKGLAHGGKYKDNWELSAARAVEVVHFMIKDGGMPPERLSAAGFADQLPVAKNDTDDGRKQNRRIEIVLLPNIEDLPPMDGVTN